MSQQDFSDFLNKNQVRRDKEELDSKKQKQEWLDFVESFYLKIESWLKPFILDKRVAIDWQDKRITEEYIGSYDVKVMKLKFEGAILTFDPVGTMLIGTKGRIDLKNGGKNISFVLVDKNTTGTEFSMQTEETIPKKVNWVWKIADRNISKVNYIEFTEDNFFSELMRLVNSY